MTFRHLPKAVLLLATLPIGAQLTPPAQPVLPASASRDLPVPLETFTKKVREVNLVFSVADRRGRFVSGLRQDEIHVLDNGKPPDALTYFQQQSELPLRVGIVIDLSGSVERQLKRERESAALFLQKTLRPDRDQAFIVGFNTHPALVHDLTGDAAILKSSLNGMRTDGETALHDAVIFACRRLRDTRESAVTRRVLIVISDGDDNVSRAPLGAAVEAALEAEVTIFTINNGAIPSPKAFAALKQLAENTGGTVLPGDNNALPRAFRRVELWLRNQYAVGFRPAAWTSDREFHSIHVAARRHGVKVLCRKGYYAVE